MEPDPREARVQSDAAPSNAGEGRWCARHPARGRHRFRTTLHRSTLGMAATNSAPCRVTRAERRRDATHRGRQGRAWHPARSTHGLLGARVPSFPCRPTSGSATAPSAPGPAVHGYRATPRRPTPGTTASRSAASLRGARGTSDATPSHVGDGGGAHSTRPAGRLGHRVTPHRPTTGTETAFSAPGRLGPQPAARTSGERRCAVSRRERRRRTLTRLDQHRARRPVQRPVIRRERSLSDPHPARGRPSR